jgi:hypothetical protein
MLFHERWAMKDRVLRPSTIEEYFNQAEAVSVKRERV